MYDYLYRAKINVFKGNHYYDIFGLLESSRHSPLSDQSSLFDSVSGTAINLGGRVGTGGTPVQLHGSHQRISSLAKEARDVQPGLIKDSTMMRPAISDSGRALATEAHPNPSSIPEEECIRGEFFQS